MSFHAAIVAPLFLLLSSNGFAGDLSDLLQRVSEADLKQNYQGTFILIKPGSLSTLRVTHGSDESGVWESLEALDGEARKVIRRDNQVVSIYPNRELVTIRHTSVNQSLHPQLPANIDQLELYYSISRLDDDRVANHQTLVIDLIPKDELRYGYRYWVDKNTGMLLRCDLVAEDKSIVEQMVFTTLEYLPQSPVATVKLSQFAQYKRQLLDKQKVNKQAANAGNDVDTRWEVKRLPKGFMLTQQTIRHVQPTDLLHLVYSDGLASVSVFIEKNNGADDHMRGASTMGAINAFGAPLANYFVTVVGEVPLKTVQLMAQSTALSSSQMVSPSVPLSTPQSAKQIR